MYPLKIETLRYLGISIGSNNMLFGNHNDTICSKARNLIGLRNRKFYGANSATLLQLYLTMIRPHLEYASPVGSPFVHKEVRMILDVEKVAMRVTTKRWDMGYWDLLNTVNIFSLESRRPHTIMCTMWVAYACSFPPDVIQQRPNYCQQTNTISPSAFCLH